MKKPEREFVVEIDKKLLLGVSPESMLSIKLMENRTGKENMTYSAPIEWLHATLARKHQRENPTGKKRPENLIPLYRLEKDMILAAKFAIQRGGISSRFSLPSLKTLSKLLGTRRAHPTGKAPTSRAALSS